MWWSSSMSRALEEAWECVPGQELGCSQITRNQSSRLTLPMFHTHCWRHKKKWLFCKGRKYCLHQSSVKLINTAGILHYYLENTCYLFREYKNRLERSCCVAPCLTVALLYQSRRLQELSDIWLFGHLCSTETVSDVWAILEEKLHHLHNTHNHISEHFLQHRIIMDVTYMLDTWNSVEDELKP